MNWTMIGALGEILGAFGVILTLWYLASQVRQARIVVRQEAERELIDQNTAVISWISESPERSSLWMRGIANDPSLKPEELGQFRAFLFQLILLWQRLHHLDKSLTLTDPWFAEQSKRVRAEMVGSPGFKSWMEVRAHWLEPEFRAVLESEMANGPGYKAFGVEREPGSSVGEGG